MTFTKKYFKIRSGLKIKKFKKWWENDERKVRSDCISITVKELVQEFYRLPEISREVPGKAEVMVIKDNSGTKALATKHHMTMTLQEV